MKLLAENLMIEPALSGGSIVRFETLDIRYEPELNDKYRGKKIKVDIKEDRKGRSLDANAYCWVLCDKIAAELKIPKVDVYRQAVRDYGVSVNQLLPTEGIDRFVHDWEGETGRYGKCCDVMNESRQHIGYTWVRVFYGTSDYDTKEMSIFLDGLVSDAQELGIETATPDEIERLKQLWGGE